MLREHLPEMRALREAGHRDSEIAQQIGCTRQRVGQLLGRRGNRPPRREAEFIAAARDLWHTGMSAAQIGKALGVSRDVIIGVRRKNVGFDPRPSPIRKGEP